MRAISKVVKSLKEKEHENTVVKKEIRLRLLEKYVFNIFTKYLNNFAKSRSKIM